jgi:hypothetical protein
LKIIRKNYRKNSWKRLGRNGLKILLIKGKINEKIEQEKNWTRTRNKYRTKKERNGKSMEIKVKKQWTKKLIVAKIEKNKSFNGHGKN